VVGYVTNTDAPGAIDIDAEPVVCQTAPQVAGSSETARIDDWFSGVPAASAAMTFFLRTVYSTDGGTTWNNLDATAVSRGGSTTTGIWAHATNMALLDLTQGTSYIFGVQIGRITGTTDPSDSRCEVLAQITRS